MEHNMLSLDFWQDTVTYEGNTLPTGTLACDALNIPDDMIAQLHPLCDTINSFLKSMNAGAQDSALLPATREAAMETFKLLHSVPPFSCLDLNYYLTNTEKVYSEAGIENWKAFMMSVLTGTFDPNNAEEYTLGASLDRITKILGHLAYSLTDYKEAMTEFALKLDAVTTNRRPEGLAELFGQYFSLEEPVQESNNWMAFSNNTFQYVSAMHPDKEIPMLTRRMHYVSFVGMFRSDFFEGLCVGHAPKKCQVCGRWFLTTNARHTKYCNGFAPGNDHGLTCRQVANWLGRKERELAANHPIKQIYTSRMNTITQYLHRGTIDPVTAERMKFLGKRKMEKALRDPIYAETKYKQEMTQKALFEEAKKQ